ncbi:Permease of the drug/metabolite transporter (DMT) superfamily [hydrothermal vent metagenome]|uniref:Permease of the drug/metabolite transporter (DMT) superfamily n=1 Tax=hydrothermal vent metagenome TaxID=652676 RepID=A0A3B0X3U3_9ZZZZ
MPVPISYLSVILIWSTTPLAIQWSGNDVGFQFGVAARMAIGLVALLVLLHFMKIELPWHKKAQRIYLISGITLYIAMSFVYWAAQHIPSGWISVVFGLSPIFTSMLASFLLNDSPLSGTRLTGMLLGLLGLMVVFIEGMSISSAALLGIAATVISAASQSTGSVLIKQQQPDFHPIAITTGSIIVALPLFLLNCFIGGNWPETIPLKSALSILYLGLIGSAIGFPLYFYLLKKLAPERVAIIMLITPITALLLGAALNNETISNKVWLGTALILTGLAIYEYGKYLPHVKKWKIRWLQRPL